MATIQTAIQIQEGMASVVRSLNSALNICISSFKTLQTASGRSMDTSGLVSAGSALDIVSAAIDRVGKNIREVDAAQQQLKNQMRNSQDIVEGLMAKFKQITTCNPASGIKLMLDLSNGLVQTRARLDLVNDGMQTTSQLQDRIFQSAQRSRSSYFDMAQIISKLGTSAKDSFSSNREMIAFAEQMNKQFKLGGGSLREQAAGMNQLMQAMASGRLQGDDFDLIIGKAPLLAQAIAQYTGKSIGELRQMSSEGLITADVIKSAMFAAADETNRKFANMPVTFEDVWNMITNGAKKAFEPVAQKISAITKSDQFQKLVDDVANGLVSMGNAAIDTFNTLSSFGNLVLDKKNDGSLPKSLSYSQAYSGGYKIGEKFDNILDLSKLQSKMSKISDIVKILGMPKTFGITKIFDIVKILDTPKMPGLSGQTAADILNTPENTGSIKDAPDISTEDEKKFRDIDGQGALNKYITTEIKVDMANHNIINNNMDLDGMITYLKNSLENAMQSIAEGVHK